MGDEQGKEYQRGFTAGYQARCREESETYLRVVQGGRQIYDTVLRRLIDVPTAAERRAERQAVLVEGHAAELHVGRFVDDCPTCQNARRAAYSEVASLRINRGPVPAHKGHYGVPRDLHFRRDPDTGVPHVTCINASTMEDVARGVPVYVCGPECPDPCADGCSDPEAHAEGAHDV